MLKLPSTVVDLKLNGKVRALDPTNDGSLLAVGVLTQGRGPALQVFRTADGKLVRELAVGREVHGVDGVAFADDERFLYYAVKPSAGGAHELWRAPTEGEPEKVTSSAIGALHSIIRDPQGRLIGLAGKELQLWDVSTGKILRQIAAAEDPYPITAAFGSEPGQLYLYGREAGKIVLHDLKSGKDLEQWDGPQPFGAQLAVSRSGRYLAAVGWNGNGVHLFDTKTGKRLLDQLFKPDLPTCHFAFTHDESFVVTVVGEIWAFRLPSSVEPEIGPPAPGRRTWACASAREAPVIAFGIDENRLLWCTFENQ